MFFNFNFIFAILSSCLSFSLFQHSHFLIFLFFDFLSGPLLLSVEVRAEGESTGEGVKGGDIEIIQSEEAKEKLRRFNEIIDDYEKPISREKILRPLRKESSIILDEEILRTVLEVMPVKCQIVDVEAPWTDTEELRKYMIENCVTSKSWKRRQKCVNLLCNDDALVQKGSLGKILIDICSAIYMTVSTCY